MRLGKGNMNKTEANKMECSVTTLKWISVRGHVQVDCNPGLDPDFVPQRP